MNAQIITQVNLKKYLVYHLAIFVLVGQIITMFLFNRIIACMFNNRVCMHVDRNMFVLDCQNIALVKNPIMILL